MNPTSPVLPRHVAVIMDGNGRWARQRGLPRLEGHRQGVKATQRTVEAARELGLTHLTLYAFSAENWGRPQDEIRGLVGLLEDYLPREVEGLRRHGVRLRVIGRWQDFPPRTRAMVAEAIESTRDGTAHHLTIALAYGSRQEVVDAFRAWGTAVRAGQADPDKVTWEDVARHLYTHDLPDPDLVIRTSGEFRMSNFLLLQSAYAEWHFTPVLWPDFGRRDLELALAEFAGRERRFGQTGEQVKPGSAQPARAAT